MANSQKRPLPLITSAYLSFAVGLLAGFSGAALFVAVGGVCCALFGAHRGNAKIGATGLLVLSGAVIALLSSVPARRLTREERAAHSEQVSGTVLGRARVRAS